MRATFVVRVRHQLTMKHEKNIRPFSVMRELVIWQFLVCVIHRGLYKLPRSFGIILKRFKSLLEPLRAKANETLLTMGGGRRPPPIVTRFIWFCLSKALKRLLKGFIIIYNNNPK